MANWKPYPKDPRYLISDEGQVRGPMGKILKPRKVGPKNKPYLAVHIGIGNNSKIHHLVLDTFVGPRPAGYEALHADDDQNNNALSNLSWGTHADNMKQAKMPRGKKHWNFGGCYHRIQKAT